MPASLALLLAAPAPETVLIYRLRGEVRPLLFWVGKDNVGGGRVTLRRIGPEREAIEVLFGSDPDRTPRRVNRWGYGTETADWTGGRLTATEFLGIMRHSDEQSMDQVAAPGAGGRYRYDGIRSVVAPSKATTEIRVFADEEEFHFRHPERLIAKFHDSLTSLPPTKKSQITKGFAAPYGFLTGLAHLLREVAGGQSKPPALTFVFNAMPYTLEVVRVRTLAAFGDFRDVAQVDFRCFNTVKRTRTEFTLWTPRTGELKALPVRIRLQPRWWLRLQMDLEKQ